MKIDLYTNPRESVLIGEISVRTTKGDVDITLPGKSDSLRVRKGRLQFIFYKHWTGPTYLRDETDGSYYLYLKRFTPETMLLKIKHRSMGPTYFNVSEDLGFFDPGEQKRLVSGYRLTNYGCYIDDESILEYLEVYFQLQITLLKTLDTDGFFVKFYGELLDVLRSRIKEEQIEVYIDETIEVEPVDVPNTTTQNWLPP